MHKLEQPHQFVQIFCIFYKKNLLFLFYTSTFTKYSYQFIYFTHLFNKIFILLHFLLFSHSWPLSLSLSLRDPATIIITQSPSSQNPDLSDPKFVIFFVSYSHGWSEPKPRWSQNPNQVETQTYSSRNPRLIGAKVD